MGFARPSNNPYQFRTTQRLNAQKCHLVAKIENKPRTLEKSYGDFR